MKNTFNLKSMAASCLVIVLFMGISPKSNAQLSLGTDVRQVFNWPTGPSFLLKYKFADQRFAGRLSFSGNINQNNSVQNFYEDDMYTNLDKWPSEMSMEGSFNRGNTWSVTPGIEMHLSLAPSTSMYFGVQVGVTMASGSSGYNNHSAYKDQNTGKYTIGYINSSSSESSSKSFAPGAFIGMEQTLGKGFSVFGELGIAHTISQGVYSWDQSRYTWNFGTEEFEQQPKPDAFKDQDQPWNWNFNWTPNFRLYINYTFGSNTTD